MKTRFVTRFPGNPILTPDDIPYPVETVHNAGVTKHQGRYLMLFRSHLDTGRSIIGLAESKDGFHFAPRPEPFLTPGQEPPFREYEEFGVEDPRITLLEGVYYITYSAYSRYGVRIALAKTTDFESVERSRPHHAGRLPQHGSVPGEDRRPLCPSRPAALGDQPVVDLDHLLARPGPLGRFAGRDEAGALPLGRNEDRPRHPPIQTTKGWLSIYHGVFPTMAGAVYRLGVALHDLADPARILGVCDRWILQPEDPWEVVGYVHNVVFTCGAVPEDDGTLKLYWGGADKVMCAGTAVIDELVDACLTWSRPAL